MKIMAFDPGGTTGYALHSGERLHYSQLGPGKHHLALWSLLAIENPDVIVYERFVYQRRELSSGVSLNLDACEYIGILKLWGAKYNIPLKEQGPSEAKKFCTDEKMKIWAFDLQHKDRHAKDALRHLVYYETIQLKWTPWLDKLKKGM